MNLHGVSVAFAELSGNIRALIAKYLDRVGETRAKTTILSALPVMSAISLAAALLAPTHASAALVTYDTTTSQLCVGANGCGTNSQTLGGANGLTVTYVPIAPGTTVDASPSTFAGFGAIQVACAAGGTSCGEQNLSSLVLYLNVTQTGPSAGVSQLLTGTFEGPLSFFAPNVGGSSSTALLRWTAGSSTTIGDVTYAAGLFGGTSLGINPPSSGGGLSPQLAGTITAVPLPAASLLFLSGLGGLGVLRRKRRVTTGDAVTA